MGYRQRDAARGKAETNRMSPAFHMRAWLFCGSVMTAPLMHMAFAHDQLVLPAIGAGAAQASLATWLATPNWRSGPWRPARRALSVAAGAIVFLAGSLAFRASIGAFSGLMHAALNLVLLMVFGGSLRPGRTPVVTVIARAAHGTLPPELIPYTRAVTWLWAGFAAAQLIVSPLLLAFAPLETWSLFVNGLDMPAILALFAAEYAYRRHRFGALTRLSSEQIRRAVDASISVWAR